MQSQAIIKATKLIKKNSSKLNLSRKNVKDLDCDALFPLLASNVSTISKLDLHDNQISELGASTLVQALLPPKYLKKPSYELAVGEVDLQIVSNLNYLDLSYNKLGSSGAEVVADLVRYTNISTLNLTHNNIRSRGLSAISQALTWGSGLKQLFLNSNGICQFGIKSISQTLLNNPCLQELHLSYNNIRNEGIRMISEALTRNNQLKTIALKSNYLDDQGMMYITKMLAVNDTITHMDLSLNAITDDGATILLTSFESNETLLSLNVNENAISLKIQSQLDQMLFRNFELLKNSKELFKISRFLILLNQIPTDIKSIVLQQFFYSWDSKSARAVFSILLDRLSIGAIVDQTVTFNSKNLANQCVKLRYQNSILY
ncbi:hypothetical protein BC833DRAFT_591749 [Globomyces pollinis-pini]|nr:hypothetical protein BC833DRAFT_591749 [Globomyces pollinis-pini]